MIAHSEEKHPGKVEASNSRTMSQIPLASNLKEAEILECLLYVIIISLAALRLTFLTNWLPS